MTPDALVVGAGPAGLMAADMLLAAGHRVLVAEAKPSPARKFLMAGKSGLNITRVEETGLFVSRYAESADWLAPMIAAFDPAAITCWMESHGQNWFIGSTGRVFPVGMKASPLLRAWLRDLGDRGLDLRNRWRWLGFDGGTHHFDTPDGPVGVSPRVTVLALGGASWARLGSDGAWAAILRDKGVALAPFQPSNAGLVVPWSAHMAPHHGAPLKSVLMRAGSLSSRGEAVVTARGLEGGGLYPLTPALREGAPLHVDLFPDVPVDALAARLSARPKGESVTNTLKKALKLSAVRLALAQECARPLPTDPLARAQTLKALTLPYVSLAPMDQAISTAGGITRAALTRGLMLQGHPGLFAAGEMLDWEAPTGGYLLTACLATGRHAGLAAARFLRGDPGQDDPL